tara:strand:+ start:468 stop:905 length:438 start_codon:yes stop_codon:yes gene_type:complete
MKEFKKTKDYDLIAEAYQHVNEGAFGGPGGDPEEKGAPGTPTGDYDVEEPEHLDRKGFEKLAGATFSHYEEAGSNRKVSVTYMIGHESNKQSVWGRDEVSGESKILVTPLFMDGKPVSYVSGSAEPRYMSSEYIQQLYDARRLKR